MMGDLLEQLADRLQAPLPGPMEGTRFAPQNRTWPSACTIPDGARSAAVLLLLYPADGCWHLPLTLRPQHLPDHAGQVSLPGGAVELNESTRQAAVRELHEEIGAEDAELEMLGRLSPIYVHVSNFRVDPHVAVCHRRPRFVPNPAEVDEILEVPLAHLLDPANLSSHERHANGHTYRAPHFAWGSHRIWGATCLILGELVTLLDEIGCNGSNGSWHNVLPRS